uniref:Alpha/beta hydrolase fold-3 domain-containing protein n=1 Tax=Tetranychus urticae TaxID=32264 RepID=T1K1S8_TETUR
MEMENLMFDLKLTTISPVSLNKRLIESCDQLFRVYQQLSSVAPSLDFPGVHANGIRSLCSIIDKFASMIRQNLDKETIPFEQIIDVIELFGGMGEVVLKQRRIEIETKNDSNQLVDDSVFLRDVTVWWNFCKSNQSRLTTYFEKFTLFFIEPEIRLFISLIVNGAALSSLTYKGSLYYPLRTWSLFDNPVVNSVASWQASKYSVQATTVFIPRQDKWFIPSDGSPTQSKSIFSTSNDSSTFVDKKIRCRLLQSKIHQPNGKLVLHIAGGGFVMFKPEASEGAYLQYWVSHLDGTTFLSVDYTKLVTYPIAFQEVLDVYLWAIGLSNADQCTPESVLGFKPSKVVLCGDSAGSHLAFSILRSLHDIQANSPQGPRIPFPTGFVSFYTNISYTECFTFNLWFACFRIRT